MKEDFIKAALLGTDKFVPNYELPGTDLPTKISEQSEDKADVFLKQTAVALTYHEAGIRVSEKKFKDLSFSGEIGQPLERKTEDLLRLALQSQDYVLIRFLTEKLQSGNAVVSPNLVPAVLDLALKDKDQAAGLLSLCGEVGKWLVASDEHWKKLAQPEEDNFDTGSFNFRKLHLEQLRATNPDEALDLLKENIAAETAEKRAIFLSVLEIGINPNDEEFLEQKLKDKSSKVRAIALELLQLLPDSRVSGLYLDFLKKAIQIKDERVMLIAKKKVMNFLEIEPDEALFKLGMGKISSEKGIKDHHFWIAQALAVVNPTILAEALKISEDHIFQMILNATKKGSFFFRFLKEAVVKFQHQKGAHELMKIKGDILLIKVLPVEDRPEHYLKILPKGLNEIFHNLKSEPFTVLPEKLSLKMIDALFAQPYSITANEYYELGFYLSEKVLKRLEKEVHRESEDYQKQFFAKNIADTARGLEMRKKV